MSSLHIIHTRQALEGCQALLSAEDAILLIHDAVLRICFNADLPPHRLLALRDDLQARGLMHKSGGRIEIVGFDEFVNLCCEYDKTVSWF